ncbi:MAG: hypothetical protein CMF60_01410 [Magnetococcales bacterium]|nr:hypothetical protein [Magnetococcales bacterium]|tara:strand:- start:2483 stop:3226 length:744 start_codon:yes stop_codon:yes gene_type:complete
MNKNIIITGGTSYSAQHLSSVLNDTDFNIFKVGKSEHGTPSYHNNLHNADIVINIAHTNNIEDNKKIVEEILNNVKETTLIIQFSSIAVYGPTGNSQKIKESSPLTPRTDNGRSKLAAEEILSQHSNTIILRIPQIYGENIKKNSIGTIYQKLSNNQDITLTSNGELYRDFLHVKELSKLVLQCINTPHIGTFNIGSGKEMSQAQFVQKMKKELQSSSKISLDPTASDAVKWAVPCTEKFCKAYKTS